MYAIYVYKTWTGGWYDIFKVFKLFDFFILQGDSLALDIRTPTNDASYILVFHSTICRFFL